MKARILINIPNLRVLEQYGVTLPDNKSSCFSILPNENLEEVMRRNGLNEEEVKLYCTRILKGNPHWVDLEHKEEVKQAEQAKEEVKQGVNRKEELLRLTKSAQAELLLKLGVEKKKIPTIEPDRVAMIMELEKK